MAMYSILAFFLLTFTKSLEQLSEFFVLFFVFLLFFLNGKQKTIFHWTSFKVTLQSCYQYRYWECISIGPLETNSNRLPILDADCVPNLEWRPVVCVCVCVCVCYIYTRTNWSMFFFTLLYESQFEMAPHNSALHHHHLLRKHYTILYCVTRSSLIISGNSWVDRLIYLCVI